MTDKSIHMNETTVGIKYQDNTDPRVVVFLERLLERAQEKLTRVFEIIKLLKTAKCRCVATWHPDCVRCGLREELTNLMEGNDA